MSYTHFLLTSVFKKMQKCYYQIFKCIRSTEGEFMSFIPFFNSQQSLRNFHFRKYKNERRKYFIHQINFTKIKKIFTLN